MTIRHPLNLCDRHFKHTGNSANASAWMLLVKWVRTTYPTFRGIICNATHNRKEASSSYNVL